MANHAIEVDPEVGPATPPGEFTRTTLRRSRSSTEIVILEVRFCRAFCV